MEESRLAALEERIDAELGLGEHAQLVGELEALVREHPLREALIAQLMLALYGAGRQVEALDAYQQARVRLADELGLEPGPALKKLEIQILEQAPALQASPARPRHSAGAAREGSGRAEEHATAAADAVDRTGGRSRHGLRAASRSGCAAGDAFGPWWRRQNAARDRGGARVSNGRFADGVCWVELAGVDRPDDVGSTVARALVVTPLPGESPREALRRHLARRRLLLAIDNFEHVLQAAELVADLHGTCPELALLVTSRENLNLAAEQLVVVAPLAVPAIHSGDRRQRLNRSRVARCSWPPPDAATATSRSDTTAAPAIAQICARLDGLPLALELAAARTAVLGVEELAARLGDAVIDLGVGPRDAPDRQRTLDATIEWSYRMLDEPLQRSFVKFAVFAGGATLEAARAVTGADLADSRGADRKELDLPTPATRRRYSPA